MKTILVTGANGQLGNSIRLLAGKYSGYNFLFTDVDTLDITDPAAVRAVVKDNGVNYILNCAAYTAVDKAEDDEALCPASILLLSVCWVKRHMRRELR